MDVMIENKVVPKLRFGEFSNSWEISKFNTYCDFQQGVQVDIELQKKKYEDGYIKFLRIENYTQKSIDFRFIPDLYKESKRIDKDDIVVVRYGATAGYIGRGFKGILANNLFKIIPDKNVFNKDYLYQYLISFRVFKFFQTEMIGGAMPALSFGIVKHLKVPITSISEQQKIASFLSSVDDKLQQLTKKKDLLEEYKKGVMQKIFSQELRFTDDNGNNYPDWEEKKMGEIGETFNGLTGKTKEDFGRGKPFIQYMQIFNSAKIDTSKFGYVDIKEGEKQKTAQYGDVFFTTSSETPIEIGYASVLTEEIEGLYLNSFCFGYRPNSLNELYPDFASYLFRSESLRKQIVKLAQGSTRYNMSKVQLMKVLIQLPSLDEQQKIANFLSSLDSKIDLVSTQIENTKSFKKGLLQQMFV